MSTITTPKTSWFLIYEYIPNCIVCNEKMTHPLYWEIFQLFFIYFNRNVNENIILEFILQKHSNSVNILLLHLNHSSEQHCMKQKLGRHQLIIDVVTWENLQTQNYSHPKLVATAKAGSCKQQDIEPKCTSQVLWTFGLLPHNFVLIFVARFLQYYCTTNEYTEAISTTHYYYFNYYY